MCAQHISGRQFSEQEVARDIDWIVIVVSGIAVSKSEDISIEILHSKARFKYWRSKFYILDRQRMRQTICTGTAS